MTLSDALLSFMQPASTFTTSRLSKANRITSSAASVAIPEPQYSGMIKKTQIDSLSLRGVQPHSEADFSDIASAFR